MQQTGGSALEQPASRAARNLPPPSLAARHMPTCRGRGPARDRRARARCSRWADEQQVDGYTRGLRQWRPPLERSPGSAGRVAAAPAPNACAPEALTSAD